MTSGQAIPVLSLWQPWASLMALGIKSIETRSWSTSYRGRLAIAATASVPSSLGLGRRGSRFQIGEYSVTNDGGGLLLRGPSLAWPYRLPLGAVVSTHELTDVLPMVDSGEESAIRTLDVDPNGSLWIAEPEIGDDEAPGFYPAQDWREVSDQAPYGHFERGRFAWLTDDHWPVVPPAPFKGGQGLTRKWVAA